MKSIISKLYDRSRKYEDLYGIPPKRLLLTISEFNEFWRKADSMERVVNDLNCLGMEIEVIFPEEISEILSLLTDEQLALLITSSDSKARHMAEQEVKNRKLNQK